MATLRLKFSFEMEHEDCSPEILQEAEVTTARLAEQIEARWATALAEVQKKYPDLKFGFDLGDEEEGWRGE